MELLANLNDVIVLALGAGAVMLVLLGKTLLGKLLGLVVKSKNKFDDKLVLAILKELVEQGVLTAKAKNDIVKKMVAKADAE